MTQNRYAANRFFLKDTVRQQVDFATTDQYRMVPPPPLQKPCAPETARIDLPDGPAALDQLGTLPLGQAIRRRQSVRDFSAAALSMAELAALLWGTQGVRAELGPGCALRTVPSAGSRHSFETYLAINRVTGLAAGLYRYLPFDGQLARLTLDRDIGRRAATACLEQQFVAAAAVTFVWTTIPARMEWRYSLAAHKVIAIDAGHVCQNLYLLCESMDAGMCAIAAYDQEACDRLLGVDGQEEFTVYIAALGKR